MEEFVSRMNTDKRRAAVMLASLAGDGGVSCEGTAGISRVWGRLGSPREAMSSARRDSTFAQHRALLANAGLNSGRTAASLWNATEG